MTVNSIKAVGVKFYDYSEQLAGQAYYYKVPKDMELKVDDHVLVSTHNYNKKLNPGAVALNTKVAVVVETYSSVAELFNHPAFTDKKKPTKFILGVITADIDSYIDNSVKEKLRLEADKKIQTRIKELNQAQAYIQMLNVTGDEQLKNLMVTAGYIEEDYKPGVPPTTLN